jgi:hypothetical protein
VQVHEIVDHATLQVILNRIDNNLLPDIHNLQIREVILIFINCLVNLLVIANAIAEILRSLLWVLANVVGRGGLDFEDVAHDQLFIVALTLYEERLDSLFLAALLDPAAARLRAVGGVEDGDDAARLEPGYHVVDSCFRGRTAHALSLHIIDVEEVGGRMGVVVSAVAAYVEDSGINGEPLEVALGCGGRPSVWDLPATDNGSQGLETYLSVRLKTFLELADRP